MLSSPHIAELEVGTGWQGTAETIRWMQELVSRGKRSWTVIDAATQLARSCPFKDRACWAHQVFGFLKSTIKFVGDPHGIELIEHPAIILQRRATDCDGMAIIFNTMVECLGMPSYYKTICSDSRRPTEFSHVYSLVEVPKVGMFAADLSEPRSYLGWEPRHNANFQVWPGSKETR